MINWLAVKRAADIAEPNEGFIDNNRKMNPVPVDPFKQARNQAFQQKMVEVPKAYAKGIAQDVANPQAWRDAVESVGTQLNRAWHGRAPYAHMLYKGPISSFGKFVADKGEKYGWITPRQAQQQRATWDWWTQPQREQIAEIEKRYPYAQRLESNPYYNWFGQMAPEAIVGAGVSEAGKAIAGIPGNLKKINNGYREFKHKQKLLDRYQDYLDRNSGFDPWNPEYRDAFISNGMNPNDFVYSGKTISANELSNPDTFANNSFLRQSSVRPLGGPSQAVNPSIDLSKKGNKLWGTITDSNNNYYMRPRGADASAMTMDDRFLQKWPNGRVLINNDGDFVSLEKASKVLNKRGYTGGRGRYLHDGDLRMRRAMADIQGYSPGKTPSLKYDMPEVVREIPEGYAGNPIDDIHDFVPRPDSYNGPGIVSPQDVQRPVFTRKGTNSMLVNNTHDRPFTPFKWPANHKLSRWDAAFGALRGKSVPQEAYR